jgi:hypothetical protein
MTKCTRADARQPPDPDPDSSDMGRTTAPLRRQFSATPDVVPSTPGERVFLDRHERPFRDSDNVVATHAAKGGLATAIETPQGLPHDNTELYATNIPHYLSSTGDAISEPDNETMALTATRGEIDPRTWPFLGT